MTNTAARAPVSSFYALSPPVAAFIYRHENLKVVARVTLYAAVILSPAILRNPGETGLFILGVSLLGGGF